MKIRFAAAALCLVACSSDQSTPASTTPVNDAGTPTADAAPTAQCPTPTGPTTHPGTVATETWTAALSPHIIGSDTSITGTLTIEPCAEVQIAAGKTVGVGGTGKIVALGTATQPIHIGKKDDSPFASITAVSGGTLQFAYVTVDGGGDPLNAIADTAGMISLQGSDQTAPTQPTFAADHVTLSGSKSNGVVLQNGAGFAPSSNALTITGSAVYPINIWSRAVDTVPTGTYTGNGKDEIVLPATAGNEAIRNDATMHNRGVPYRVGTSNSQGTLTIATGPNNGSLATLTIEAGVTVKVIKGGVISVEPAVGTSTATGALIAAGTADAPIVFTSAEATPAAGDWLGIWFGETPAASDKIDHAQIQYAGGTSTSEGDSCNIPPIGLHNDAAIRIFGPPGTEFVTNTAISDSAANGIDRSWQGTPTEFLTTNTFTRVARCTETYPRASTLPACPTPVPCPQ